MKKVIYIQEIGEVEQSLYLRLKKQLKKEFKKFNFSVKINSDNLPLYCSEYDETRKKYDAKLILERLTKYTSITPKKPFRTLGLLDEDITTGKKIFRFGLGSYPKDTKDNHFNCNCLISITRLKESFYGKKKNKELLDLRIFKESIHELGHTFNLEHCDNYCVMKFSEDYSQVNKKPAKYCDSCLEKLKKYLKSLQIL